MREPRLKLFAYLSPGLLPLILRSGICFVPYDWSFFDQFDKNKNIGISFISFGRTHFQTPLINSAVIYNYGITTTISAATPHSLLSQNVDAGRLPERKGIYWIAISSAVGGKRNNSRKSLTAEGAVNRIASFLPVVPFAMLARRRAAPVEFVLPEKS